MLVLAVMSFDLTELEMLERQLRFQQSLLELDEKEQRIKQLNAEMERVEQALRLSKGEMANLDGALLQQRLEQVQGPSHLQFSLPHCDIISEQHAAQFEAEMFMNNLDNSLQSHQNDVMVEVGEPHVVEIAARTPPLPNQRKRGRSRSHTRERDVSHTKGSIKVTIKTAKPAPVSVKPSAKSRSSSPSRAKQSRKRTRSRSAERRITSTAGTARSTRNRSGTISTARRPSSSSNKLVSESSRRHHEETPLNKRTPGSGSYTRSPGRISGTARRRSPSIDNGKRSSGVKQKAADSKGTDVKTTSEEGKPAGDKETATREKEKTAIDERKAPVVREAERKAESSKEKRVDGKKAEIVTGTTKIEDKERRNEDKKKSGREERESRREVPPEKSPGSRLSRGTSSASNNRSERDKKVDSNSGTSRSSRRDEEKRSDENRKRTSSDSKGGAGDRRALSPRKPSGRSEQKPEQKPPKLSRYFEEANKLERFRIFFMEVAQVMNVKIEMDVVKKGGPSVPGRRTRANDYLLVSFSSIPSAFLSGKCNLGRINDVQEEIANVSNCLEGYSDLMNTFEDLKILTREYHTALLHYKALPDYLASLLKPLLMILVGDMCKEMYKESFKSIETKEALVNHFRSLIRKEATEFWKKESGQFSRFLSQHQTDPKPSPKKLWTSSDSSSSGHQNPPSSSSFPPTGCLQAAGPAPLMSIPIAPPPMTMMMGGPPPQYLAPPPMGPGCFSLPLVPHNPFGPNNIMPPMTAPPPQMMTSYAPIPMMPPPQPVKDDATIAAERFIAEMSRGRDSRPPPRRRSRSRSRDRDRRRSDERQRVAERSRQRVPAAPAPHVLPLPPSSVPMDPVCPPGESQPYRYGYGPSPAVAPPPFYPCPTAAPPSFAPAPDFVPSPAPLVFSPASVLVSHHAPVPVPEFTSPPCSTPSVAPPTAFSYQPPADVKTRQPTGFKEPKREVEDDEYDLVFQ